MLLSPVARCNAATTAVITANRAMIVVATAKPTPSRAAKWSRVMITAGVIASRVMIGGAIAKRDAPKVIKLQSSNAEAASGRFRVLFYCDAPHQRNLLRPNGDVLDLIRGASAMAAAKMIGHPERSAAESKDPAA
jgi:hypothetical protein